MTDTQPSLRDRQRQMTRQLILDAYADLSLERGFDNFTMQDIADAAGISHRTLYRHYENREAILDGMTTDLDSQVMRPVDTSMPPVGFLVHNYAVFGRYRKPMRLVTLLREAGITTGGGRDNRTQYMREALSTVGPGLSDLGRQQLLGLSRLVAGAISWVRLTSDDINLTDEQAGAAAEWAFRTLIEAAEHHEGDLA
jgi:AcrR family transcriptional regulator